MPITRQDWETVLALIQAYGAGLMFVLIGSIALWTLGIPIFGQVWIEHAPEGLAMLCVIPINPCRFARLESDKILKSRFESKIPWQHWLVHYSIVTLLICVVSFAFQVEPIIFAGTILTGLMCYSVYGDGPLGRLPRPNKVADPETELGQPATYAVLFVRSRLPCLNGQRNLLSQASGTSHSAENV